MLLFAQINIHRFPCLKTVVFAHCGEVAVWIWLNHHRANLKPHYALFCDISNFSVAFEPNVIHSFDRTDTGSQWTIERSPIIRQQSTYPQPMGRDVGAGGRGQRVPGKVQLSLEPLVAPPSQQPPTHPSTHQMPLKAGFWEQYWWIWILNSTSHGPRRGPELKKNTHLFCWCQTVTNCARIPKM